MQAVYRWERKVKFREDYFDIMPDAEIDKQINQLLEKNPDTDRDDSGAPLSTTKLQGVTFSAIDPPRASAQGF